MRKAEPGRSLLHVSVLGVLSARQASHVLPLVLGVGVDVLFDSVELAFLLFQFPELEDFRPRLRELLMFHALLPPSGDLGERLRLIEEVVPAEDAWQHELHEDGGREPSQISVGDSVSGHVGPLDLFFQPGQLLEDLSDLCRPCGRVHASLLSTVRSRVGCQVHRTLRVGKVRLRAVR